MPDDPTILDSVLLFRRIHPDHIYHDKNENRIRPSSAAFSDDQLSIYFDDLLAQIGKTARDVLVNWPEGSGVASILASFVRQHEQIICRDPDPNDQLVGSAHGLVVGYKKRKFRGKKVSQWLAYVSNWEVEGVPY